MANLRTATDILQDALFRAGEPANSSSEYYNQSVVYLNRSYQSVCSGGTEIDPEVDETWWWLRKATPGVITLQPSVNIPTASIASGATVLTYSSPPLDRLGNQISVANWMFQIQGDNGDIYRITAHVAGSTNATIDSPYTGGTAVGSAQRTMQFQYSLASDLKSVVGRMRAYQMNRYFIDYADLDPMRTQFPLYALPAGVPVIYSMVGEQMVEFSHYAGDDPTSAMRIEYDYLVIPPDLLDDGVSAPLIPFQYRQLLSDYTAFLILADKDDNKSQLFLTSAKAKLLAMSKEHRRRMAQSSNLTGKIQPRQADVKRFDFPLRTQSGLIIG